MFRRAVFVTQPPPDDYIVSPTGFTWNVRRSLGPGTVLAVSAGTSTRAAALALASRLAKDDCTDAWETTGADFRLIQRFRPASGEAAALL